MCNEPCGLNLNGVEECFCSVDEVDAVGFFNCGEESGASQPRKHFQFVPMEAVKSKMPFYTGTQTRLEVRYN